MGPNSTTSTALQGSVQENSRWDRSKGDKLSSQGDSKARQKAVMSGNATDGLTRECIAAVLNGFGWVHLLIGQEESSSPQMAVAVAQR